MATSLLLLGVLRHVIIEELLLSDGAERSPIVSALDRLASGKPLLGVDVPGSRVALLQQ